MDLKLNTGVSVLLVQEGNGRHSGMPQTWHFVSA